MNIFTKSITRNFNTLAACILLSISGLLLQACSKDTPPPVQEVSVLSIINTSPTLATFNIYLDKNKINTNGAVSFGGNTGYFKTTAGAHNVKFTTASSIENIFNKDISLEKNAIYSLFLIDKADKMDFLQIKDEPGNVSGEKAYVRFINLSPDAPALNLGIKDGNSIITDKVYKASSAFIELEAKTYVFEIKDKATGTLKRELTSTELKAGKSYTIIARGIVTPGEIDQPLSGQIIINQ